MSRDLFDIDLDLLLLRYGERQVIAGMAKRIGKSPEELYAGLSVRLETSCPARLAPRDEFRIDEFVKRAGENGLALRELYDRFENRTYLPELKDVKRFFERQGIAVATLKSRQASRSKLFAFLSSQDHAWLARALREAGGYTTDHSDLALISEGISRGRRAGK